MYQSYLNRAQATLPGLTTEELKELLNDDDKLEVRVNEALTSLESEKDVILNDNRRLAEDNLKKEPEFIEKRSRLSDDAELAKSLCSSIQEKLTELKSKSSDTTPDTALALLQTAAAESEEASEKLVKQFMSKGLSSDEFLEKFLELRKEMHLRKVKADKMTELLRQPAQHNRPPMYPSTSNFYPMQPQMPPGGGAPYPMGGMPYPTGGMPMMPSMPMPNNMYRQY